MEMIENVAILSYHENCNANRSAKNGRDGAFAPSLTFRAMNRIRAHIKCYGREEYPVRHWLAGLGNGFITEGVIKSDARYKITD